MAPISIHIGSDLVPINLSIKNAPEDLIERVRARAKRNHRSLQGEVLAILSQAVSGERAGKDALLAEMKRIAAMSPVRTSGPFAQDLVREGRAER